MIKAIIFDCFGVLYPDTFWTMAEEYLGESLQEKRQQLSDLVRQVDLGFITRDDLWARFAEIVGSDEMAQRLRNSEG
jgi:FMN phosphatase YigB (HAD superfamily)